MKTETLDAAAQDITLDGGPVAKTTDKLSDKVIPQHFISSQITPPLCPKPLSPLLMTYFQTHR